MTPPQKHILFLCTIILSAATCAAQTSFVLDYSFGSFRNAQRLSLDSFDHIFVTDAGTNTVNRFRLDGSELKSIGGVGWGQDQFDRPLGIDAGFSLQIYVADYGNHRIQRFDGNLNYIGTFYNRETADPDTRFGYPIDVAISRLGEMYILDSENNRIVKVNTQSIVERTFGSIEAGKGQLRNPRRIHIGSDDNIYVLEDNNIVVFDSFGSYRYTIGDGIISQATGFFIENDLIWVVSNKSLIIFKNDSSLMAKIAVSEFLGVESLSEIHDVAVTTEALFILTSTKVYIFKKSI